MMTSCVNVTFRLDFPTRQTSQDEVVVLQGIIEAAPAVWNLHA
jgi:hypothetical protein